MSVCLSVGQLVGWSVIISQKGRKLHFPCTCLLYYLRINTTNVLSNAVHSNKVLLPPHVNDVVELVGEQPPAPQPKAHRLRRTKGSGRPPEKESY